MNTAQQKEEEYIESIDSNFVGRKFKKLFMKKSTTKSILNFGNIQKTFILLI